MNEDYNSILKEKKVYNDQVTEPKHPILAKYMILALILSLVVIIISYIVYYNTILKSETILLNNIIKLKENYQIISSNIIPDYNNKNNYMQDGTISINDIIYNYSIIKDNNKIKRTIYNNTNNITYYYDGNLNYLKTSKLNNIYIETSPYLYQIEDYKKELNLIETDISNYIYEIFINNSSNDLNKRLYNIDNINNIINNITKNFTNNTSNNYIKKFYIADARPIVEVSLVLNTNQINKILENSINNLEISDDIQLSITMKNDAIKNNIQNIKIVINNKTKNERNVITYDGKNLIYKDNKGLKNKFILTKKNNDFTLKYYKDDILYSVLSGTKDNNTYTYTYQVIDKKYNITLLIAKSQNEYQYNLKSNIEDKVNNISITGKFTDNGAIEEDISTTVKEQLLNPNQEQIIKKSIKEILFS